MEDKQKKINGPVVLVILLLLVLIGQSAYLIHLQSRGTGAPEVRTPVYSARRAAAPAVSAPVQTDPWDAGGVFGSEWDPFREMEQMRRAMNRMFRESYSQGLRSGGTLPAMTYNPDLDLSETENEYTVRLDLPGIDKDKISVKTENGMLILSGERSAETEQTDRQGGFYRTERSFGSFVRSFPLPPDADADKMTAESKNGVLTVHIPKSGAAKKPASSIAVQ